MMIRLPGLLLMLGVVGTVGCGAQNSTVNPPARENSRDDSQDVAADTAATAPDAAAIQELLGDPVVNSLGIVLIPVPAGEFQMGSPASETGHQEDETRHLVQITKPFYLSAHEVTQQQYESVMGHNPTYSKDADKPVENVIWNDALDFCGKLSEQEGQEYRLPTEAEWEYACRAGTITAYSFGDDASRLGQYAWHSGNSDYTTHTGGEKLPNHWGLYDMHGNVWEWCQDRYAPYGSQQESMDPAGPEEGSFRVLRGGSFSYLPRNLRSADRFHDNPVFENTRYGFRLAREYNVSP
ncbi:MAG: hypothetical protein CMJ81_08370 [Planctomycetaceae bacterium]|nr:hypothetical protein [Planctomycetaceae bacterium]